MDKKGYIKSLYMYNMLIDRMDDPLRRRILIKEIICDVIFWPFRIFRIYIFTVVEYLASVVLNSEVFSRCVKHCKIWRFLLSFFVIFICYAHFINVSIYKIVYYRFGKIRFSIICVLAFYDLWLPFIEIAIYVILLMIWLKIHLLY